VFVKKLVLTFSKKQELQVFVTNVLGKIFGRRGIKLKGISTFKQGIRYS